jgi:hypothetical protein
MEVLKTCKERHGGAYIVAKRDRDVVRKDKEVLTEVLEIDKEVSQI